MPVVSSPAHFWPPSCRGRKRWSGTEPTFLVRDVMITRYGIMADPALDRILPDKQAQDATTRTDFSDSFGISHS